MAGTGQRLLLSLPAAASNSLCGSLVSNPGGWLVVVGGTLGLILVVLMCSCRNSDKKKKDDPDIELQLSLKKGDKNSTQPPSVDSAEVKLINDGDTLAINGGVSQGSTFSGHSRQASSGSAHLRPTSLRELPEPPVSTHHARNKSLSAIEALSTTAKSAASGGGAVACGASGGGAPACGASGGGAVACVAEGSYPMLARHSHSVTAISTSLGAEVGVTREDGYDHLGPKPTVKPTDYDSLAEPEIHEGETPVSDVGLGLDGHYSSLRESTYAVVGDVKAKAKQLFDPYSQVRDKGGSSNYYSQVKDDHYNQISDTSQHSSFIQRLQQARELHDFYMAVQEESRDDSKSADTQSTARGLGLHLHAASSWVSSTPASPQEDGDLQEEYAVVQKVKNAAEPAADLSSAPPVQDLSPYSAGPPEPPRLYNNYLGGDDLYSEEAAAMYRPEHKYSKVTARESLASMTARNALNPYELVPDLPENMYATVEGGSGDGVVFAATNVSCPKRLSQASDTYAEIGVAATAGLVSSIISSGSSTGGNNNNSNNNSSSTAPAPPSLDSLHLMTKSQTSSEGDRLSDRHLASPEDSAMSFHLWGDSPDEDDYSEDGYSTLKKMELSPLTASLPTIPDSSLVTDQESGEVTLVSNFQKIHNSLSDGQVIEELENDPNYESVEETRAKVALLRVKAENSSLLDSRALVGSSQTRVSSHMNSVFSAALSIEPRTDSNGMRPDQLKDGQRQRRLNHDYEEVDVTPPPSPVIPHTSVHHMDSPTYQNSLPEHNSHEVYAQIPMNSSDVKEAREQVIQAHMYEELAEVRAKSSEIKHKKKASTLPKNSLEDTKKAAAATLPANFSGDKKKHAAIDQKKTEEKGKSASEEKQRLLSGENKKSASGKKASGNEKIKLNSKEKRKSKAEDKKKGVQNSANGSG